VKAIFSGGKKLFQKLKFWNSLIINKNIAAIFRKENILKFKRPKQSLSVADFYKVLAYARLYYAGLPKTDISDITVSFAGARHPRTVLRHLREVYGYGIEERRPGIYYIPGRGTGGASGKEEQGKGQGDTGGGIPGYGAGSELESGEGVLGMKRLRQLLEEEGWSAEREARGKALGEARGESKKALEIVKKALSKGMPVEDISDLTGADSRTILSLKN
jgi:hypothetical protein